MKSDTHQASPAPPAHPAALALALLLALLAFFYVAQAAQAPVPNTATGASSPQGERFSAIAARDTLAYLLGDQRPHPMGSDANRAVKLRVIETLEAAGASVTEQDAVGCVPGAMHCGFVENVIATLPGQLDETIVLMAHYDSTTNSPGAGDDVAGVSTILEVMRVLAAESKQQGRPYRNTIQAVITDGEEQGLFGAEAFFAEHPDAEKTSVLINVEGSGTAGPSNLLRTSPGSGDLVRFYRQTAPHPMASSIATEIFKRMPNDTDFSVGMRAEVKGLDFAFAGERTHYHTPLDTVENLDLGTLQHHGDNVLPLMRRLAEEDLGEIDGELSYTTMLDLWAMWRESWSLPMACAGALLLLISMALQRKHAPAVRTLLAILTSLLLLIVAAGSCAVLLRLADWLAGATPAWPGTTWPWRLLLLSGAVSSWAAVGGPLARRLGFHPMLNGAWFWIAVMSVLVAAVAPLAASPFLVPLLVAATLKLALAAVDRDGRSVWWHAVAAVSALAGVVYLGGLMPILEESQGYQLAPSFYIPLVFSLLLFTPFFAVSHRPGEPGPGRWSQPTLLAITALVGIGISVLGLKSVPLYTDFRPQPVTLLYVQDLDNGTAQWLAGSYGPLPDGLTAEGGFEQTSLGLPGLPSSGMVALAEPVAWQSHSLAGEGIDSAGKAPHTESDAAPNAEPGARLDAAGEARSEALSGNSDLGGGAVKVVQDQATANGRELTLRLSSPRRAGLLRLLVSRDAQLERARIAGHEIVGAVNSSRDRQYDTISIYAAPAKGVEVVLQLGSAAQHEHVLMDVSFNLPDQAQPLLDARAPLAAPAHQGDRWMAIRRVRF